MPIKDLTLKSRCQEFQTVVESAISTDIQGKTTDIEASLSALITFLMQNREQGHAVYLIGNGGSAAIASHAVTDFANVCQLRAFTLHDSSLLTCLANDFGYEQAFARSIQTVMRPNDILIAISSSGKSPNICHAASVAKKIGGTVITLTGFQAENPLRKLGDVNLWLNSSDYGIVETGHAFLLHNLSDRMGSEIKKAMAAVLEPV